MRQIILKRVYAPWGAAEICELLACHEESPVNRVLLEGKIQNIKAIIEQYDRQAKIIDDVEICSKDSYRGLLKDREDIKGTKKDLFKVNAGDLFLMGTKEE